MLIFKWASCDLECTATTVCRQTCTFVAQFQASTDFVCSGGNPTSRSCAPRLLTVSSTPGGIISGRGVVHSLDLDKGYPSNSLSAAYCIRSCKQFTQAFPQYDRLHLLSHIAEGTEACFTLVVYHLVLEAVLAVDQPWHSWDVVAHHAQSLSLIVPKNVFVRWVTEHRQTQIFADCVSLRSVFVSTPAHARGLSDCHLQAGAGRRSTDGHYGGQQAYRSKPGPL